MKQSSSLCVCKTRQLSPFSPRTRSFSTSRVHRGGKAAGYPIPFLKSNRRIDAMLERTRKERIGSMLRGQSARTALLTDPKLIDIYPEDMGLFDGTVVFPLPRNRPGFFTKPWYMTKIQTRRVWRRLQDFISLLRFKFEAGRPYRRLNLRQVTSTGIAMHRQMYTSFAEGDKRYLQENLCSGIRDQLLGRLAVRPHGAQYLWTLHKYIGRPRVVSQRCAQLPIIDRKGKNPYIRQAVIQIKSLQSLEMIPDEFNQVEDKGRRAWEKENAQFDPVTIKEKELIENFVIQKRLWNGKDEPWKIWGTVEETPWEDIETALRAEPKKERDVKK